jgi:hypothetical protein
LLFPALGMALLVSFAFSAVAASAASASTQHWSSCQNVGFEKGEYSSPECNASGEGNWFGWQTVSSPYSVTTQGQTPVVMRGNVGGIKLKITCSSMGTPESEVENPAGGGAGMFHGSVAFSSCSLAVGKSETHCSIRGGSLFMPSVVGEAIEFESAPALKIRPTKGQILLTFTSGPDCPTVPNTPFELEGSFTGVFQTDSSLKFSAASSNVLMGGNPVSIDETAEIVAAKGASAVKLAP